MSQSPAARSKESANPRSTRQLLDELDDLMNQMLSLPVEDEPKSSPTPAVSATLTMIEPEEPPTPLPLPPVLRGERVGVRGDSVPREDKKPSPAMTPPSPPTPLPRSTGGEGRSAAERIPINRAAPPPPDDTEAISVSNDMLVEDPASMFAPFRREARPVPPSNASWLTRSLVVFDRSFRRLTRRLGPLGWLMRSSFGRMLLGLCGLACWLVALAWLIKDWMHWTR